MSLAEGSTTVGLPTRAHQLGSLSGMAVDADGDPDRAADSSARTINGIIALATELNIGTLGLHLAVSLFDEAQILLKDGPTLDAELVATVCLKLADAFDEQSQEYFQRERMPAFIAAVQGRWAAGVLLEAEKRVAQRLGFRIHRATSAWFLRAAACAANLPATAPHIVSFAVFVDDLLLLDDESRRYPAALRAHVSLLIATYALRSSSATSCQHAPSVCDDGTDVPALWREVRKTSSPNNHRAAAVACFARATHVLITRRGKWTAYGLHAVERRHPDAARKPLPVGGIPARLAEELLPGV